MKPAKKHDPTLPGRALSETDYEALAKSWIDQETAQKAQLRRVADIEAAEILARKQIRNCAGILFPYFWPGDPRVRDYRIRVDEPELELLSNGLKKERGKYLSPTGGRSMLYFGPRSTPAGLKNPSLPLAITEGEKKTLALDRLAMYEDRDQSPSSTPRWLSVGISGVYNWHGRIGIQSDSRGERVPQKGPISDLDDLTWSGRKVYIIFDRNVQSNRDVFYARRRLATELRRRGALPLLVDIPNEFDTVNGIDDYISVAGPEKAIRLIHRSFAADVPRNFTCVSDRSHKKYGVRFYPDAKKPDESGLEPEAPTIWVCDPLEVVAQTRDANGSSWGRLLRWNDGDGKHHQWAMPMAALAGDSSDIRKRLLDGGLLIGSGKKARELLDQYIQQARPQARVRCVSRIGWHNGSFVLPDETIGPIDAEEIIFQSEAHLSHSYRTAGTLSDWRDSVSQLCIGNTRLVLGVSISLAAAALQLMKAESGGFHLHAPSSKGKTTWLIVSGSAWGGGDPKYGFSRNWKTTSNGLEAVAVLHNGALLPLDEIGQKDPKELVDDLYHLINGQAKLRATKTVELRDPQTWSILMLSTGEVSLAQHIDVINRKVRGGHSVRLVEIPADAGSGMGLFEELHGRSSPAAFSDELKANALRCYGTPIRTFIQELADDTDRLLERLEESIQKFMRDAIAADAPGEVHRVAKRMALVAAAGELATDLGITAWPPGESFNSVMSCFKAWMQHRGAFGSFDEGSAVRQIRLFISTQRSRFQELAENSVAPPNRCGWWQKSKRDGLEEYIFQKEVFEAELCKGYGVDLVVKALRELGPTALRTEGDRDLVKRIIPELGTRAKRMYVLTSAVLDDPQESDVDLEDLVFDRGVGEFQER